LERNESILNLCQTKTTTEEVLVVENENRDQNPFPQIVNNITNVDNNKIDGEYFAAKTHLSESTESILHEDENRIASDALKPSGSQVKSNEKDGDNGGVYHVECDTKIVVSCILMIFIFCKNQFI